MKHYTVRFRTSAENTIHGWKNASLPLGNGYMGLNVFGDCYRERIQLTEPTLVTGGCPRWIDNRYFAGQESFGDLWLDFPTLGECSDYERTLSLDTGVSKVKFTSSGVRYERTCFASYPDRVGVLHLSASEKGALTFSLSATIANLREHLNVDPPPQNTAKRGECRILGNTLILSGVSEYYGILFEGQFSLLVRGGECRADGERLTVLCADEATVLFTLGTNYILEEKTFSLLPKEKLKGNPHPHKMLSERMEKALSFGYEELLARHTEDHASLFSRCILDLGGVDDGRTTHKLITSYREGVREPYLEELYFCMGRYMSIATSREGTLPPGLQGKWNAYEIAPWTAGYWYNVNQQMNYWGIFSTNLADLYMPYLKFNLTRLPMAQKNGADYIKDAHPDRYEEGEGKNGWIVGTGNSAYHVGGAAKNSHSGPGTGGFTAISDIDFWRFTCSREVLFIVYPILEGLGRFYDKCTEKFGEEYLVTYSASPEIQHEGKNYITIGCAFDQQMVYESVKALIEMYDAERENLPQADGELISRLREKLPRLSPVLIGASGQIKEFREENFYGEIGEKQHRHISQLVGLYPGTVINENTHEWLDGAKKTLHFRGIQTGTGWSLAHKLGMWARVGEGEIACEVLGGMIKRHLFDNLFGAHDNLTPESFERAVFQADSNFGATAGIAEMLLSSSGKYIRPLFALPSLWDTGEALGFVARGNFVFDMKWQGGVLTELTVTSRAGSTLRMKYPNIGRYRITKNGVLVSCQDKDTVEFPTELGDIFIFSLV